MAKPPIFKGFFIYKKIKINPYRDKTDRWKSFEIIRDGIGYYEYLSKGGYQTCLRHMIDMKYVELKHVQI